MFDVRLEESPVALFRLIPTGKKFKYPYKPVSASFQPGAKFQPVTITYQLDPASKEALKTKTVPKPQPKNDNHAAAFVFGLVVSGVASAAAVLWKTPRSGAKTREMIADRTEATLFHVMGMDDYLTGEKTPTALQMTESSAPAFAPGARGASPSPFDDTQPIATLDDDGGSLPPTYRGEVLTEVPTATSASASPTTPSTPTEVATSPHGSNHR
jgi:hypothetical protein